MIVLVVLHTIIFFTLQVDFIFPSMNYYLLNISIKCFFVNSYCYEISDRQHMSALHLINLCVYIFTKKYFKKQVEWKFVLQEAVQQCSWKEKYMKRIPVRLIIFCFYANIVSSDAMFSASERISEKMCRNFWIGVMKFRHDCVAQIFMNQR